jgi:acyl carrier protein phosphodiesterase
VRKSTKRLHKKYSHYSGIIVDMLYDHFLAKNWSNYCKTDLSLYTENFYTSLETHYNILPNRIQKMIPHMLADNWLVSYASKEGIGRALEGMNRRTKNKAHMDEAINELDEFYEAFENEFTLFFKELIAFSENKLQELKITYYQE